MTIELRPELEALIREHLGPADEATVQQFVTSAIWAHLSDDCDPDEDDDVSESIAQFERGEAFPAEQVFAEMRAKHGLRS